MASAEICSKRRVAAQRAMVAVIVSLPGGTSAMVALRAGAEAGRFRAGAEAGRFRAGTEAGPYVIS
jgi:hypothetical protein